MSIEQDKNFVPQQSFRPGDRVNVIDPQFLPGNATVTGEVEVTRPPRNLGERIRVLLTGHSKKERLIQVRFDDFDAECSVQCAHMQYIIPLASEK